MEFGILIIEKSKPSDETYIRLKTWLTGTIFEGKMNALDILKLGGRYNDIIEEEGMVVEFFDDYEAVPEIARQTGRSFQMPGLSTTRNDHTQATAFWLFLKSGDEYIGGVAALLQDIGDERFDKFLKRTANNHFPNPSGPTIESIARPLANEVAGKLAYIGELHFKTKNRGQRKVLKAVMRMLQLLVVVKWDVDWIYAFIPNRHMEARLDLVYGFTRSIPDAQIWSDPVPELRSSSEWFVGTTRADLKHMISSGARRGHEL